MINFHIIASGSKGNASIIYNENTTILIDCGITKKRLIEGLLEINKTISSIDFVLITHEHSDHIKGIKFVPFDKVYSGPNALDDLPIERHLRYFETYNFKDIQVTVLKTNHDACSPCGFLFKVDNEELVYLTDSGIIPLGTLELIKNKDYYFFEANHDLCYEITSSRTAKLKERVISIYGHLSNDFSAAYLNDLIGEKTKKIVLAHISEECNSKEKIYDTFNKILNQNKWIENVEFVVAEQDFSVDL